VRLHCRCHNKGFCQWAVASLVLTVPQWGEVVGRETIHSHPTHFPSQTRCALGTKRVGNQLAGISRVGFSRSARHRVAEWAAADADRAPHRRWNSGEAQRLQSATAAGRRTHNLSTRRDERTKVHGYQALWASRGLAKNDDVTGL